MLHWHSLVRLSDAELARIDIAALNLACAHGLPGADRIDWPATGRKLSDWAKSCAKFTEAVMPQFRAGRHDPGDTEAKFRVIAMISHLQRDLGVKYNPGCIPDNAKFRPEDTFIHGITDGDGGSCASLPVLYTDIGRRRSRHICAHGGAA
jgi:hypothetical protein